MSLAEIRNDIQSAFNEYLKQFLDDSDEGMKAVFSQIFQVSIDKVNEVLVDGVPIGINASDCETPIYYEVDKNGIELDIGTDGVYIKIKNVPGKIVPKIEGIETYKICVPVPSEE